MGFFIHVRAKLESAVPCPWLEISMRLGGTTKKQGGARPFPNSMNGFDDCIDQCGSEEFSLEGLTFTRTNSSSGDARIDCRLDRVLFNTSFLNSASNFNGKLLNAGLSDHHAILITESSRPKVKALLGTSMLGLGKRIFSKLSKKLGMFILKESPSSFWFGS